MGTASYPAKNIIPLNTVMNANINSSAQQLLASISYAIQIVFTGTPTGTFKLQASNDVYPNPTPNVTWPVNWSDVANSSFSVAAAGNVMWTVEFPGYNYVRVVYTDGSSGSSAAIITSATFNAKG